MSTSLDHHEQAGPLIAEAAVLLNEQASTTTAPHIGHVVLPPADASISTSDHHDHEQASRPSTIEAAPSFTKQVASTCTSVIGVVILPPARDPLYLYYSCIFLTLFSYIYIYIYIWSMYFIPML